MKVWIETAAELGSDIVFWDEPHFYMVDWFVEGAKADHWACCCPTCRNLYEEKYGHPMPDEMNDEVIEFREGTIVNFFSELGDHVKTCFIGDEVTVFIDLTLHANMGFPYRFYFHLPRTG